MFGGKGAVDSRLPLVAGLPVAMDKDCQECETADMNKAQHDILSFGFSAVMDLHVQHESWQLEQWHRAMRCLPQEPFRPDWFGAAFVGLVRGIPGGRIQDTLEPAEHPNHRGFFHSWLLFAVVGRSAWLHHQRLCTGQSCGLGARLLNGFGLGSCTHFASDAPSAKGLPIVGLSLVRRTRRRRARPRGA